MVPRFQFSLLSAGFALGLSLLVICTEITSNAQQAPAPPPGKAAPPAGKPAQAATEAPLMTIADAKGVAKSAYEVLQKGTNDPRKVEQLLKDLDRAKLAAGLAPHQLTMLAELEKGLKAVQALSLDGWEDATKSITGSERPKEIRKEFAGETSKRRQDVRDAAKLIAEEFLAIGDLADKLSLTNQEFQQVLNAREVLAQDIRSLGAHIPLDLGELVVTDVKQVVDIWMREPNQAAKPGINTAAMDDTQKRIASDRLTRIKERLEARTLEPIDDAKVEDLIEVVGLAKDKDGENLKKVNQVLDSIPLLKQHASFKGEDGAPLTPTKEEIQMLQIACRLLFWQEFSDRVTKAVLKASVAKAADIEFDPRFQNEGTKVEMSEKAKLALQRIKVAIEKSNNNPVDGPDNKSDKKSNK